MSEGLLYGHNEHEGWNRAIGPFYKFEGAARKLGVDSKTLAAMTIRGELIALRTREGDVVYPARQFFLNEDAVCMVRPAVSAALRFLMEHEKDFADIRVITDKNGPHSLLNEWTIAGVLFQPNEKAETLIDDLERNLSNPEHESWARLIDLNGIATHLRNLS